MSLNIKKSTATIYLRENGETSKPNMNFGQKRTLLNLISARKKYIAGNTYIRAETKRYVLDLIQKDYDMNKDIKTIEEVKIEKEDRDDKQNVSDEEMLVFAETFNANNSTDDSKKENA
ncbi:unnamed protein product [Allacma fusca]|uniref:Uncharacterized protein n=1 Tax=Allacma fusca TaxID=39272 RepID=A0A8J2NJ52_9HEXA|nr:unnamed protein product [Allacma fusca]